MMPWTNDNYPVSMKNLDPAIREKAIEIANALLKEDNDEGRAIAIGTAKAEEWGKDHLNIKTAAGPSEHQHKSPNK